jgi:hypothetical protein
MCRMLVTSEYSMTEPPVHGLPQSEFRVGQTFGRAWQLFSVNVWTFLIVTVISELPVRAYFRWGDAAGELLVGTPMRAIVMFLGFVLVLLGQAILVRIGFRTLRGQAAGLREALQEGSARFSAILGLSLAIAVLMFGILGTILLLASFLGPGLLAMVFMVAVGMLIVRWSLALPACVVEGLGLVDGLARSATLTRGHRWKIFGIMILLWVPLPAANAILRAAPSFLGPAFQYLGQYLLGVVWITGFTSVLIVIYHDLRAANEGLESGQIASVFD